MDLGMRAVRDRRKRSLEVNKVMIVANTLVVAIKFFEESVLGFLGFTFGAGTEISVGNGWIGATKETTFLHEVPAGFVASEWVDRELGGIGDGRFRTGALVLG